MEKIRLKDGTILEIIPMGIETNIFNKTRKFYFISVLGYGEIEGTFSVDNISNIEYLSANDELLKTYTDCSGLKMVAKEFNKEYEDGKFADIYMVELITN